MVFVESRDRQQPAPHHPCRSYRQCTGARGPPAGEVMLSEIVTRWMILDGYVKQESHVKQEADSAILSTGLALPFVNEG